MWLQNYKDLKLTIFFWEGVVGGGGERGYDLKFLYKKGPERGLE